MAIVSPGATIRRCLLPAFYESIRFVKCGLNFLLCLFRFPNPPREPLFAVTIASAFAPSLGVMRW